jgi:predicted outer membrane repeat protein
VTNSSFFLNHVTDNGGAIYAQSGTTTLTRSSFHDNWAGHDNSVGAGGALWSDNDLYVSDTTFDHNGVYNGGDVVHGGAVELASSVNAFINNSTISNNWGDSGGGLDLSGGESTLTNVTISDNNSFSGAGGIYVNSGAITLTSTTMSGNFAYFYPGGINSSGGTITVRNTIVANNGNGGNCGSPIANNSFSLSNDNTCGFGTGRDNVDVKLAPLGNYGGPTMTQRPLPDSPAIDFGTDVGCPSTDQRGKPRPAGLACDVGAVERQPVEFSYWLNLPLILR